MENKFSMTVEENIFVAKRNVIDYIWKSANLEGIGVTFPETEAVYKGINVASLGVDDVVAINNLKHGWQFVIETIDYPIDYAYICRINQLVGNGLYYNAGFIRSIPVRIGGTSWLPSLPIESRIREAISEILSIKNATERAISLMLFCMRQQMFLDGNKRTSMLAANHIMIGHGVGILSVPIEFQLDFSKLLIEYYETGIEDTIKEFVYENCIDGIDFSGERTSRESQEKLMQECSKIDDYRESRRKSVFEDLKTSELQACLKKENYD